MEVMVCSIQLVVLPFIMAVVVDVEEILTQELIIILVLMVVAVAAVMAAADLLV